MMKRSFEHCSVEQVRRKIDEGHAANYALIDVRQPSEYEQGHIPGALLMPLGELETRLDELPEKQTLFFYCRSGKRSQAAAMLTASEFAIETKIYSMDGGIMAWNGTTVTGFPAVGLFTHARSVEEALKQTMDLERGAELFYEQLLERIDSDPVVQKLNQLAKAEEGHARILHSAWCKVNSNLPPFDTIYNRLEGRIVEGGKEVDYLLALLNEKSNFFCFDALELALQVECAALDLYSTLALQYQEHHLQEIFTTIAQAEKEHIKMVAQALAFCV